HRKIGCRNNVASVGRCLAQSIESSPEWGSGESPARECRGPAFVAGYSDRSLGRLLSLAGSRATDDRPAGGIIPQLEVPADHARPVAHDAVSHPARVIDVRRQPDAVVFDREDQIASDCGQMYRNLLRLGVLN